MFNLNNRLRLLFAKPYAPAWVVCSVPILALPIALFAPTDILSKYPALMSFVAASEQWVPMIRDLSLPTDFPQVAKLYYSVMLVLSPLWFYCMLLAPEERLAPLEYIKQNRKWYPYVLIPFLLVILFSLFYPRTNPYDAIPGIMSLTQHSRLFLGVLGGALMGGVLFATYIFVVWVKWVPRLYFKSSNSN